MQRTYRAALVGLLGAGLLGNAPAASEPLRATYVVMGADGQAIARVITDEASCPAITLDGQTQAMSVRAAPAIVPQRGGAQKDGKEADFPVLTCESYLPKEVRDIQVSGQRLPSPQAAPQRIVIIGDTGCRMKQSENAFQDCNDTEKWPFAQVAEQAARMKPDLVIHVGDYHYRESPCPEGRVGCSGSPWAYGFDAWDADFFQPAKSLLAAAPWVVVRGNHESCFRAGQGWFRFLDPSPWTTERSCDRPAQDKLGDYSEPYAVPIAADSQLIVFDSSKAAGKAYGPSDEPFLRYREELQQAARLAQERPHSLFLNHHPILAFAPQLGTDGRMTIKPGNAALQSVMSSGQPQRLFPPGVDAALHGHVHLFQAISFASDHPATFVSGNGSSATDKALPPTLPAGSQPAPGATVDEFFTSSDIGFLTMDRSGPNWLLTEWNRAGKASLTCLLYGSKSHCTPAK